ncbi:MAG: DOMON-like domain-containing protein [Caulobacteraceae bacterium]
MESDGAFLTLAPAGEPPALTIAARAERTGATGLNLQYQIRGALESVKLGPRSESGRAEGLWRTTCLEAFVAPFGGEGYLEFNFSPSTRWAAWRFSAYREGMGEAELAEDPRIGVGSDAGRFDLRAEVDLAGIAPAKASWRAGLCAVIESMDGRFSYWALAHPAGRPDFHRPEGLALELGHGTRS